MEDDQQSRPGEMDVVPLRSAELDSEKGLTRILIAPWGEVESTQGNFVVDQEALDATIEQFRQHGTDLPIDFEHQTLGGPYTSPDGLAPAAGWIKDLVGVDTVGLMARVEWTAVGLEHLHKRQYRYLSPVALIRKSDRRLVGLHSAALTNKPAIVGMEALVNREGASEEHDRGVPLAACCQCDRRDASEEHGRTSRPWHPRNVKSSSQIVATAQAEARGALKERSVAQAEACDPLDDAMEDQSMLETLEKLRRQLDLEQQDGARQVLVAASRRIAELEQRQEHNSAEERVAAAMAAGKLTEAQRDWAMRLALKDAKSFEDWASSAPVVISLGRTTGPGVAEEVDRCSQVIAAKARSEYRADSLLQALSSEEAYVALAQREATVGNH